MMCNVNKFSFTNIFITKIKFSVFKSKNNSDVFLKLMVTMR